jgi:hypothetical protein
MKNIEVKLGALKTAEEAELKGIKTGTIQHINVEHKNETEDLEKKIHLPMKDITVLNLVISQKILIKLFY